jgi:hypothetical protein
MKIKIIKLDSTGVEEEIVKISNIDVKLAPDYHKFLVEIDGVSYILTKDDAFFIYPTNKKTKGVEFDTFKNPKKK